jgi:hypothetical protein
VALGDRQLGHGKTTDRAADTRPISSATPLRERQAGLNIDTAFQLSVQ